jgi:hypothetical protein
MSSNNSTPYKPDYSHENDLIKLMLENLGHNTELEDYTLAQQQLNNIGPSSMDSVRPGSATKALDLDAFKELAQLVTALSRKRAQRKTAALKRAKFGLLNRTLQRREGEQARLAEEEARRYDTGRQQKETELGQKATELEQKEDYNRMMGNYYQGKLGNERSIASNRDAAQIQAARLKNAGMLQSEAMKKQAQIEAARLKGNAQIAAAQAKGKTGDKEPKSTYETIMSSAAKSLSPTDYNKYKMIVDKFGVYPPLKPIKGSVGKYSLGKPLSRGNFKSMIISKRQRQNKPIPQEYILDNIYNQYASIYKGTRLE